MLRAQLVLVCKWTLPKPSGMKHAWIKSVLPASQGSSAHASSSDRPPFPSAQTSMRGAPMFSSAHAGAANALAAAAAAGDLSCLHRRSMHTRGAGSARRTRGSELWA